MSACVIQLYPCDECRDGLMVTQVPGVSVKEAGFKMGL